jgi:dipeptidase
MCDTLCVRHDTGMWFAKNSDRHPDEAQVVEWHDRRTPNADLRTQYLTLPDPGACAFWGSRPVWLRGCEHGVNEHGVAIGNEKIFTVERPGDRPRALLGMDVVRLVLERARDADEALAIGTSLVEQYGQGGSGEPHRDEAYFSSFLVADAHKGWIIETSNRTWVAREVRHGAALSNRVSLRTDWTRASADVASGTDFDAWRHAKAPVSATADRLAVTRDCVASARGPADIARAMRSHAGSTAFTVCMHNRAKHSQTTASMIADLRTDGSPPRAWVCLGNPCASVYVPIFPPALAPELADPAQWHRFARLRDRDDVSLTLASVEAELWAEADAAFATGNRATLDHFAATAFAPVGAALLRLGV